MKTAHLATRALSIGILAALMICLSLPARPALAARTITANPNPVIVPQGQTKATTTLTWDGGSDHPYAEVWVKVDNNEETFIVESGKGTRQVTVELGKTYLFKLSDANELLASVTVTTKQESSPSAGDSDTADRILTTDKHRVSDVINESKIKPPVSESDVAPVSSILRDLAITDVRVEPRGANVIISFKTYPNIVPFVSISKAEPVKAADGRWGFPPNSSIGRGAIGDKAKGEYRVDMNQELETGATYYYIIDANSPGRLPAQNKGQFTTLYQTVKVVFEKINMINDSDDVGTGEFVFEFFVNYGDPTQQLYRLGRAGQRINWGEGMHNAPVQFTVAGAPHLLRLAVNGEDSDMAEAAENDLPLKYARPYSGPEDTGLFERNVAKQDWDLSIYPTAPGETFRRNFRIQAMPANGGAKGDLYFEVIGYWELTRSAP